MALQKAGKAKDLSELIDSVGRKEGMDRLQAYLESRPFPHFEAAPGRPGLLFKIDEDGTRTVGRFVDREFTPVD